MRESPTHKRYAGDLVAMDGFRNRTCDGLTRFASMLALLLGAAGCGGGAGGVGSTAVPASVVIPASISVQPADQSVPMGLPATYSVTAAGSVTSNAASLTVTARAPMTDDLRFQQVDAPSLPHLISNRPILFSGSRGFNPRNKTALS
jgi:hypothetical protein